MERSQREMHSWPGVVLFALKKFCLSSARLVLCVNWFCILGSNISIKKKKEIKIKQRATVGMYLPPPSISTQKSFFWKIELEQDVFDAS